MTILSILGALATFVYIALIALVAARNPRSALNRVCIAVLSGLAIWSFADVFHNDVTLSIRTVALFDNVASFGWCTFAGLFVLFCLYLTGRGALARRWYVLAALLLPPAAFIAAQWLGYMTAGYVRHSFGWTSVWSDSVWPALYYAHYISTVVLGCGLLGLFARHARNRDEAGLARVLLFASAVPVVLATATNIVLPRLMDVAVPELGSLVGLLWAGGLYYAVRRHGLMSVTPESAAEDILATMADAVLLLDPRGLIVSSNRALSDTLGYDPTELVGKPARSLFRQPERFDDVLAGLSTKGPAVLSTLEAVRKDGTGLPAGVSARVMKTSDGEVKASVWVIRDTSRQVESERALREAEDRYRTFIDSFQGVAFQATADFHIEFQRGAVESLTGHPEEEFTSGRVRWRDLIHPDDVPRLRAGTAKLRDHPGLSLAREYRIRRADGVTCWVREIVASVAEGDESPAHFTGAIFDVSEHHAALDELVELSQLRESVIDSAGIWMSVVDRDMRVLAWNRAAEVITGFDRDDVLRSADVWKQIWPGWTGRLPVEGAVQAVAEPRALRAEVETTISRRDGTGRTVLFTFHPVVRTTGEVTSFIVLGRDVTERREAQASLRENEEKYRTVVENASDGIAALQDGLVKFANTRLLAMVGLSMDEVVGHSFVDRIADDVRAELVARYHRRLAGDDVPATFETRLAVKGGGAVDVEVNAAVITFEGRPADLVMVRDITGRKRELEREAKHAGDMAFLSQTAMEFVEMGPSEDVYRFIAEKLKELTGATLVFISSYDKVGRTITTRAALGFGAVAEVVVQSLGRSPVGMKLAMPEEAKANLMSGRLVEIPDGLATLGLGAVPGPICDTISELLDLDGGYAIGFAWGGELYGNASLVMRRGSAIGDPAAVEAFVRQASIALRRLQDEERRTVRG